MSGEARHPMSTIQEYHGIIHQMPGGYMNGTTGSLGLHFYRCATYFELDIQMANIENTSFASRLAPYVIDFTTIEDQVQYLRQTPEKNALLINYVFSTLDELAPHHGREWKTLEDVLTTPMYRLSLHRPTETTGIESGEGTPSGDAIVRIDSGPVVHAGLELLQTPMDVPTPNLDMGHLNTIPWFPASGLTFTESLEESHSVPTSAVLPTGEIADLLVASKTIHNMDMNRVTNPSHFAIRTYIAVHRLLSDQPMSSKEMIGVQEMVGIVTTETAPGPYDADQQHDNTGDDGPNDGNVQNAASPETEQQKGRDITYLVGILLKPLPTGEKALDDPASIARAAENPSVIREWYDSVLRTLELLHNQSPPLYHGNLQPENIYVCPTGIDDENDNGNDEQKTRFDGAFLTGFTDNGGYGSFTPEEQHWTPGGDLAALEKIFGDGGWLQIEIGNSIEELAQDSKEAEEGVM